MHVLGFEVHRTGPPDPYAELRRIFDLLHVDHVVDVGANDGQYADAIRAHTGFTGRLDCVEPQAACATRLRQRGDATVHELALGEREGEQELTIYRDTSLASLHTLNAVGRGVWDDPATADVTERVLVPVSTLDLLLDGVPRGEAIWVKLDTQGHDLAALAGLERHLDRVVGIQSEVAFTPLYDGAPEAWEHLEAVARKGFRAAGVYPIGRIKGLAFTEADVLFVRDESASVR